jgi:hypothetical protein
MRLLKQRHPDSGALPEREHKPAAGAKLRGDSISRVGACDVHTPVERVREWSRSSLAAAVAGSIFYGEVSSLLIRSSACCIPVSRAVGFGWAGCRSS